MAKGIVCFYFPIGASLGYPQGFPIFRHRPSLVETLDRSDSFWIESLAFRLFDFQQQNRARVQELFERTFDILGIQHNQANEYSLDKNIKYHPQSCLIEVAVEVDPAGKIKEDMAFNAEFGTSSACTRLFNEALAGVRSVLQGHIAATGQLVNIPTIESLPPLIPFVFTPDLQTLHSGRGDLGAYVLPEAAEGLYSGSNTSDVASADQLTSYLLAFDCNGPFLPYIDLEQEALHSLKVTGQYRAGIISLASAFELLFDDLLLLLAWELGYKPEQAIEYYFKRDDSSAAEPNTITQRVTKHLPTLLGKSWLDDDEQIIVKWREKIADLRNLVAHNGELPDEADVNAALSVRNQLRTHVANCLFSRRQEFPLTAELFLGEAGFTDRGAEWNPIYNAEDSLENQARFGRYRAEVKNGMLPKKKRKKASKEMSDLVCLFLEKGRTEYYLVDPDARKMARIKSTSKFPRALREEIEDLTELARESVSGDKMTASLGIHPSRIPIKNPNWEPAWTTLPLFEIFPLSR